MVYHVKIVGNDDSVLYEYDFDNLDNIKDKIVKPYLEGSEFFFDGKFIRKDMITRFSIMESSLEIKEILYRARRDPKAVSCRDSMVFGRNNVVSKFATNITNNLIEEMTVLSSSKQNNKEMSEVKIEKNNQNRKVFIVHGHDDVLKLEVARYLEKLELTPIILSEQASDGKTIIEKIEEHSDVGYAVILYTPCDEGGKKGESKNPRARQNVVFEHGYFVAKLGRNKVAALVKGDIEKPNDISGVVYISAESDWFLSLGKEIKKHIKIDLNKLTK